MAEAIDPFRQDRNMMERLSIGEWSEVINVTNLLADLRDRFFSRNSNYTPRDEILLYDLGPHENKIVQIAVNMVEEGLLGALETWTQNKVMNLAGDEMKKEVSEPNRKTKVQRPMVKKGEAKSATKDQYDGVAEEVAKMIDGKVGTRDKYGKDEFIIVVEGPSLMVEVRNSGEAYGGKPLNELVIVGGDPDKLSHSLKKKLTNLAHQADFEFDIQI